MQTKKWSIHWTICCIWGIKCWWGLATLALGDGISLLESNWFYPSWNPRSADSNKLYECEIWVLTEVLVKIQVFSKPVIKIRVHNVLWRHTFVIFNIPCLMFLPYRAIIRENVKKNWSLNVTLRTNVLSQLAYYRCKCVLMHCQNL
jgi:hypothetical protein